MLTQFSEYVVCGEHLFALTPSATREDNDCPMEVTLAVICDYANLAQDGKLNILGVFNEINAPMVPFPMPQMFVVVSTEAAPTEQGQEYPFELLIWDADGTEIASIKQPMQFPVAPGQRATHNQIIGISGLPVSPGDYSFNIHIANEHRRTISLHVNDRSGDAEAIS